MSVAKCPCLLIIQFITSNYHDGVLGGIFGGVI